MLRRAFPLLFVLGCHASAAPVLSTPSAIPRAAPAQTSTIDGLVDIAGASLHIHCVGDGSPPVILEAGLGNDGSIWRAVQPDVGRFTLTCVSDRTGLGYSTPSRPPHPNRQMARELFAVLEHAGVRGPYVVVGHSMGGVNVRLLASEHLESVAGMVLVDAIGDEQYSRWFVLLPEAMRAEFRENLPKLPEGLDFDTYVAGVADMAASSRSIGARPLVVLTHGKSEPPWPGAPADAQARMASVWTDMQAKLCGLSTNCAQITDPTSGHFVQLDDPPLVIASIREVVEAARAHRAVDATAIHDMAASRTGD